MTAHERAGKLEKLMLRKAAGHLSQDQFSRAFAELLDRVHPSTADTIKALGVSEQCALNWRRGHNVPRGEHAENVIFANFEEWVAIRAKHVGSA